MEEQVNYEHEGYNIMKTRDVLMQAYGKEIMGDMVIEISEQSLACM